MNVVDIKRGRKVLAEADLDQRVIAIPVDGDWEAVAAAVEKSFKRGDLGTQKPLVIRDGQVLLLNGWSKVITESSIRPTNT